MRTSAVAVLLLLMAVGAPCQEQELKQAIAQCKGVDEGLERLACFDSLAQGLEPKRVQSTPGSDPQSLPSQPPGQWEVEVVKDPIDDSTTVGLRLVGSEKEAELMLRCKHKKPAVLLSWRGRFIGANEPLVSARFGSGQAEKKRWSLSGDHKAAFAPGDPRVVIRQLLSVDRLVVQTDHFSRGTITDVFDVRQLKDVVGPLNDECRLN